MIKASLLISPEARPWVYDDSVQARLRGQADLVAVIDPHDWRRHREELARSEVIFSGWGAPLMDEEFVSAVPSLKVLFYAGGSVRYFVTDALWNKGVRVTTAQAINAIPVSEYALSTILLGLKRFWHYARVTREKRTFPIQRPMSGAYGSVVGLISYGTIARLLRQRLLAYDVAVHVYDPLVTEEEAGREKITMVSLEEVFSHADVVSLHTPLLPETAGMIRGAHFERMKPGSCFVNTARGEIVNEPEMIEVLRRRSDLQAILDVTNPEPPHRDSALYALPNVVVTPHIAGSMGAECRRMGEAMADEFQRYREGRPLLWEVTPEKASVMA